MSARGWSPGPAFHRQMYIDLVCAYLPAYGSRRELARALGVKDPCLTYLLTPTGACTKHGSPALTRTPNTRRAAQLAALLCPDPKRRDTLLYHLLAARQGVPAPAPPHEWMAPKQVPVVAAGLESLHRTATCATDPAEAGEAYRHLWHSGREAVGRIDPSRHPLARARVLLWLHDVACVLDRADLGLEHAREATLLLSAAPVGARGRPYRDRLAVHAARCEVVALNNLGLPARAREAAMRAEQLPGFRADQESWLPLLYAERLDSFPSMRRFAIGEAEALHERALALVPDPFTRELLDNHLARAYLAYGTAESLRRAWPLVERGLARAAVADVGPLRRVQLLATAARYAWQTGDHPTWEALLQHCLQIIGPAGLLHQWARLQRDYGADLERLDSFSPPDISASLRRPVA